MVDAINRFLKFAGVGGSVVIVAVMVVVIVVACHGLIDMKQCLLFFVLFVLYAVGCQLG